jgi:hypothetical protein
VALTGRGDAARLTPRILECLRLQVVPTRAQLALAFLLAMGTRALSVALYLKGQLG